MENYFVGCWFEARNGKYIDTARSYHDNRKFYFDDIREFRKYKTKYFDDNVYLRLDLGEEVVVDFSFSCFIELYIEWEKEQNEKSLRTWKEVQDGSNN